MDSRQIIDIETEPAPLGISRSKRQLFRFDSTVSMGTLLQMLLISVAAILGYGTYSADKAKDHAEVAQIKVDAENQRTAVKESLGDLKTDVKDIQRTLIDVNQNMAVLKARSEPQRRQP